MSQFKTFTPTLIPTAAMLLLALTSCQDGYKRPGEKVGDRPNQGVDQKIDQNRSGRAEHSTDQRPGVDQRSNAMGTSTGGTSTGGTSTGGTSTGGTSTGGTSAGTSTSTGTTGDKTTGNPTE